MKFFGFELCGVSPLVFINLIYSIRFSSIRFFLIRVYLVLMIFRVFQWVFHSLTGMIYINYVETKIVRFSKILSESKVTLNVIFLKLSKCDRQDLILNTSKRRMLINILK